MAIAYRTRTYIAADFDEDRDAVEQLYKWNEGERWSLSFTDAHDLQSCSDESLYCTIKASLKMRLNHSKKFVLIVGEKTNTITKGGCQYCRSYNSYTYSCAKAHRIDYRSYIEFECEKALEANITIIVLYKDTVIDILKCPEPLRHCGIHIPMIYLENGKYYWNYKEVKKAFDS